MSHNFTSLALLLMAAISGQSATIHPQKAIVNRVNAAAKTLPKGSTLAGRYGDRHRHGIYFVFEHRLYYRDVLNNRTTTVTFTDSPYERIATHWYSPDGNFLFFVIDRGKMANNYTMVDKKSGDMTPERKDT